MQLKVWWVLGWDTYYPRSGLNNVYSTHATEEAAQAVATELRQQQVFDNVEVKNVSSLLGM